jgi:hypothetical protein
MGRWLVTISSGVKYLLPELESEIRKRVRRRLTSAWLSVGKTTNSFRYVYTSCKQYTDFRLFGEKLEYLAEDTLSLESRDILKESILFKGVKL